LSLSGSILSFSSLPNTTDGRSTK